MNARPSGRTTIPLQNMSHDTLNWVMFPLVGSRSRAPELFAGPNGGPEGHPAREAGQFHEPATTRIFPLCNNATWTGLIGIVYDKVVHRPTVWTWPIRTGVK